MNMKKLRKDYGNVLWAGRKCICGLPISFTRYILTETCLYTKIGFFNIKEDEIELYRIYDKRISFTLGQRIVAVGTITIMSKDADTPEKLIKSVKKPREVKRMLDDAVKSERDKYSVRGRDMVGVHNLTGEFAEDLDHDGIIDEFEHGDF